MHTDKLFINVKPFSYLISMMKIDTVPNYDIGKMLDQFMILLLKSKQDISKTTKKCKKMLGLIWPRLLMAAHSVTLSQCWPGTSTMGHLSIMFWSLLLLIVKLNPASSTKIYLWGFPMETQTFSLC